MNLKFRNKIFLLVMSLVVGIILSAGVALHYQLQHRTEELLAGDIFTTQRTFAAFLSDARRQRQILAAATAMSPRLKAAVETRDPATIQHLLDVLLEEQFSDFAAVTDPGGRVLGQQSSDRYRLATLADLPAVRRAAREALVVSDAAVIGGMMMDITAVPIFSQDILLGVYVGGDVVDDARLDRLKALTNSEITLITEGRIAASTWAGEDRTTLQNAVFGEGGVIAEHDHAAREYDFHEVVIAGERYLTKVQVLQDSEGTLVGAYLIQRNFSEAIGFLDTISQTLIIIGVIAILLSLLLSFLLARQVSAPVAQLAEAADALAAGRYDHPVTLQARGEIGSLAAAFVNMRNAQQSAFRDLEKANTDLRRAMQDLQAAQSELIKQERMSIIGQMASGIIHDFKNPMSIIKGYAELLLQPVVQEKKREAYSRSIVTNIDRMVELTRELLDFARGETNLDMAPTAIADLVDETVTFFRKELASRSITVTGDVRDNETIPLDRKKVRRVFDNIVTNAADAIQENGTIAISVFRENGYVHVAIRDTGGGISEEIRKTMFEAFVTEGKTHGTGLGLAIARKVIEDHQGEMWAENEDGIGAIIHFRLPRSL